MTTMQSKFRPSLAVAARQNVDQFPDLAALLAFVAGGDRMFDTMGDVIGQDLILGAP